MLACDLPQVAGHPLVTDGGMETDLIFHHGVELPHFAAFVLIDDELGRGRLERYYEAYADVARRAGAGLLLDAPTWRANADWGALVGYGAEDLARVNRAAIAWLLELRHRRFGDLDDVVVSGMVGPRGDGYQPGAGVDPDQAAAYHGPQVEAFAAAGVDVVSAYTLTDPGEAVGIVRAARRVGVAVAVSFTVQTDGRLPGRLTLMEAIAAVDAAGGPDYFGVNCAHPSHVELAIGPADGNAGTVPADGAGDWRQRIVELRCNASTKSHAELDEADALDEGDPTGFGPAHDRLRAVFPRLAVLGGCCGTDVRHVAGLWGVADGQPVASERWPAM